METIRAELLIIGAGPGGYVCAIRAAQLGIKTVIIEGASPGGTCLNVGCIPSKALIHAADEFYKLTQFCDSGGSSEHMGIQATGASVDLDKTMHWKDGIVSRLNSGVVGLLNKAGVESIRGQARFLDGKSVAVDTSAGRVKVHSENVVIAAGSESVELPSLPFGGHVLSSSDALSLSDVPESLAVVGGGYIGLELGTSFAKLGSKVTVVESADRILPQYDSALTSPVSDQLSKLGVRVLTDTRALEYNNDSRSLKVVSAAAEHSEMAASKVLVTIGRQARLTGWGLRELSLSVDNGYITIDEHCQTSMRGVYAIGDVTGEPMLAHRAMAQGELVANVVAGKSVSWDKQCIPAVCFTDPEIVCVGLLPDEAKKQDLNVNISVFPFAANGRAMSVQRDDGFIRVISDPSSNVLLGIQAVGAGVSELSATFSLAIEMGARADDIAMTIHAHPTLSEGFQEACMSALGHGLHI